MDLVFEKDFEDRVDKQLKSLGFRTLRNVYVDWGSKKSQIDILAFYKDRMWCIECKSHDIQRLNFGRSKSTWRYLDSHNNWHSMSSPKRQNENHIDVAYMKAINGLDELFFNKFNCGVPRLNSAIVFKSCKQLDNLNDYTRLDCNIYTENNLHLLKTDGFSNLPYNGMDDILYDFYKDLQDNSIDREKQHIQYLKECKKNGTGLFTSQLT